MAEENIDNTVDGSGPFNTKIPARTLEGDLGILPDHAPLLGVLADGTVSIKSTDGTTNDFVINGGFISVSKNRVSILGEAESVKN